MRYLLHVIQKVSIVVILSMAAFLLAFFIKGFGKDELKAGVSQDRFSLPQAHAKADQRFALCGCGGCGSAATASCGISASVSCC